MSARCVLLVSDDALHIYNAGPRGVVLLESVRWDHDHFSAYVGEVINKRGRGSVAILNDMTDQHFKGGQRVPKVGVLDQAKVVRNRLRVAFPNYPVRGALSSKKKRGTNAPTSSGAETYLFAGVAASDPIRKTMDAARLSMKSIDGLFLLPAESAGMVAQIAEKSTGVKAAANKGRWVVFIGQHENGALRQVIIRDGQLAMTRMTPAQHLDENNYTAWAQQVSQEFKATTSYLSRFGFTQDDGLDVIVVAHPQAAEALKPLVEVSCRFLSFTANQAATLLKLKLDRKSSPYLADRLHVAWAGTRPAFALPMETGFLEKIRQARQTAQMAMVLFAAGIIYLGWQFSTGFEKNLSMEDDLMNKKRYFTQIETEYQAELDRLKALGIDVVLVQGVVSAYQDMEKERIKVLPLLQTVQRAMGAELRLDLMRISQGETNSSTRDPYSYAGEEERKGTPFSMIVQFSFPAEMDPEVAVREVNAFRARLKRALPDYEVTVERNIVGLDYSAEFSGTAGEISEGVIKDDYVAEIKIEGYTQ